MPGPLMNGLAAGEDRKDWDGPAPRLPVILWWKAGRRSLLFRFGSGVGVAHLLGRHEAGRGGMWERLGWRSRKGPVGSLAVPLAFCIALGKLLDLSGLWIKKGYVKGSSVHSGQGG